MDDGLWSDPIVIIRGDLNLTPFEREIWGSKIKSDPLAPFFRHILDKNKLVDVEPLPSLPTWSNGREGDLYIVKRLEIFLVVENIIASAKRFIYWIERDCISNHSLICLHIDFEVEQ